MIDTQFELTLTVEGGKEVAKRDLSLISTTLKDDGSPTNGLK